MEGFSFFIIHKLIVAFFGTNFTSVQDPKDPFTPTPQMSVRIVYTHVEARERLRFHLPQLMKGWPSLGPSDPFVWPWVISPYTFISSCFKEDCVSINDTLVRCTSRYTSNLLLPPWASSPARAGLVLPDWFACYIAPRVIDDKGLGSSLRIWYRILLLYSYLDCGFLRVIPRYQFCFFFFSFLFASGFSMVFSQCLCRNNNYTPSQQPNGFARPSLWPAPPLSSSRSSVQVPFASPSTVWCFTPPGAT